MGFDHQEVFSQFDTFPLSILALHLAPTLIICTAHFHRLKSILTLHHPSGHLTSPSAAMSDADVKSEGGVDVKDPRLNDWADQKNIADLGDVPEWAANARRYEWSDEFGDVGPKDEQLESILFHDSEKMEVGEHFEKLTDIAVTLESETHIAPVNRFEDAGLHPVVLENVRLCSFKVPTPVQAYCLPAVLKNLDVIGIAQTGQSADLHHEPH